MSKVFGEISGVSEGDVFINMPDLKAKGIHYNQYRGIAGTQDKGAYSVVLAGGYTDEDNGKEIIYTGEGGSPDDNGVVTQNQIFNAGNMALAKNKIEALPVRVSRKLQDGKFQYAGLYRVDDYWVAKTSKGVSFWQYRLIKIDSVNNLNNQGGKKEASVKRKESVVLRQIRDSKLSKEVKVIYDYKCQVCGIKIPTKVGPYAEGAHIKPLGVPHNGPDTLTNILCLCPNHHVMFDNGAITLNNDLSINDISGGFDKKKLYVDPVHKIDIGNVTYHRSLK